MKKVERRSCEVVNFGAITKNISGQRQLARWLLQYALKKGLLPDPREVREHDEKTQVLQMRRELDAEKLCSGI